MTQTSHAFTVDNNIIRSLIKAQAGTLGKAFAETVMNAADAGAAQVTLRFTSEAEGGLERVTGFTVTDDGKGFADAQEIEAYFGRFAFDHTGETGRVYGVFGIGRAQLWNWASTVWYTSTFSMDVDIDARGPHYLVERDLPPVPGVTIVGRFTTPLTPSELHALRTELAELVRYAPLDVRWEDDSLSVDPHSERWTHDTDDAWIRLDARGDLTVYNLGVKVRSYPGYAFGTGGVVVTKPGHPLALNMARNDILVKECAVWARLRGYLRREQQREQRARKRPLTELELAQLARDLRGGEAEPDLVQSARMITLSTGKSLTLWEWGDTLYGYAHRLTVEDVPGSRLADKAMSRRLVMVLARRTLERFGVGTVQEVWDAALAYSEAQRARDVRFRGLWPHKVTVYEALEDAVPELRSTHDLVNAREYTPEERVILTHLGTVARTVARVMNKRTRDLHLGASETAEAWTDGQRTIVLERRWLRARTRLGLSGWHTLANLIVHEMLHDEADLTSHTHDVDFYQAHHDLCLDQPAIYGSVLRAYVAQARELQRRGLLGKRNTATLAGMEGVNGDWTPFDWDALLEEESGGEAPGTAAAD